MSRGEILRSLEGLLQLLLGDIHFGLDCANMRSDAVTGVSYRLLECSDNIADIFAQVLHIIRREALFWLQSFCFEGRLLSLHPGDGIFVHNGRRTFYSRFGVGVGG